MISKYFKTAVLISLLLFLTMIIFLPKKTNIQKTIYCLEQNSKQTIPVTVSGIYYDYCFRNDCFEGSINIQNEINSGKFNLRDDIYGNFVDESGQPTYLFMQFEKFDYIRTIYKNYDLCSEWNTDWNEKYKRKIGLHE